MTNKYIIKNCPALDDQGNCFQGSIVLGTAYQECEQRNDCLLKQIAERCKSLINLCDKCEGDENFDCIDCTQGGKAIMGNYILDLLEIQECQ
jgi:hypothetical protein